MPLPPPLDVVVVDDEEEELEEDDDVDDELLEEDDSLELEDVLADVELDDEEELELAAGKRQLGSMHGIGRFPAESPPRSRFGIGKLLVEEEDPPPLPPPRSRLGIGKLLELEDVVADELEDDDPPVSPRNSAGVMYAYVMSGTMMPMAAMVSPARERGFVTIDMGVKSLYCTKKRRFRQGFPACNNPKYSD